MWLSGQALDSISSDKAESSIEAQSQRTRGRLAYQLRDVKSYLDEKRGLAGGLGAGGSGSCRGGRNPKNR
jgi:hypothetical protein